MLVREIYNKKVTRIYEDASVGDALEVLVKHKFNGILVFSRKERLVGIFCIQDLTRAIVPQEMQENINLASAMYKHNFFKEICEKVKKQKVKEVMRKDFFKLSLETHLMVVAAEFLTTDLYVFPVIEKNEVMGVVTRSELKKALAIQMEILTK
jgi:predicted transcriptional regulator